MIRRLIKKILKGIIGQKPSPPTPQPRYEPPPPPAWMEQDSHDHNHSHSHDHHHSHGHEHDHGHASDTEPTSVESNSPASSIEVDAWETPNPNAYKFTLSEKVLTTSFSAGSLKEAQGNPLAEALLSHEQIASIFGVNDFITVTKRTDASWNTLIPEVIDIIQANA